MQGENFGLIGVLSRLLLHGGIAVVVIGLVVAVVILVATVWR